MIRFGRALFVYCYSILMLLVEGGVVVCALFSKRLAEFYEGRSLLYLKRLPSAPLPRVVYFCSSAGEYEQMIPLMGELEPLGKPLLVLFSHSGRKFIEARGDQIDYVMAPIDSVIHWRYFFRKVHVVATLVCRHELWPGFLYEAAKNSPTFLVNASVQPGSKAGGGKRVLYGFLLSFFKRIFLVSDDQLALFRSFSQVDLQVVGDTKYDRALALTPDLIQKADDITRALKSFGKKHWLLLGSAWPPDLEFVMQALAHLPFEVREKWGVVVVPHDLSSTNIDRLKELTDLYQSPCQFFDEAPKKETQVLILAKLGVLRAAYGAFDLAWVGGALHERVHNVLEPLAWGLEVWFGPLYETSHEARHLLSLKVVHTTAKPQVFAKRLGEFSKGMAPMTDVKAAVLQLTGASRRIGEWLTRSLGGQTDGTS